MQGKLSLNTMPSGSIHDSNFEATTPEAEQRVPRIQKFVKPKRIKTKWEKVFNQALECSCKIYDTGRAAFKKVGTLLQKCQNLLFINQAQNVFKKNFKKWAIHISLQLHIMHVNF